MRPSPAAVAPAASAAPAGPVAAVPPAIQTQIAGWPTVAAGLPTPTAPPTPVVANNPAIPAEAVVNPIVISTVTGDPANPIQIAVPFPDVPRIAAADLKDLVDRNEPVTIADVRSGAEYSEAHIAGAGLLPSGQATGPVEMLPKDRLIVLYCT